MTPTDDWSAERIGLYTRLSQDRAGATSIQRQDDEARDVIDLKGGVLAREPYSDPDASAWKERVHRPGFDRLLADADAGDVTLVVVWACDRLTRQGEQMETFLKLMRKRGLKLYSVKEGYIDLSNGAIMPKLITWKSEMESERISMRVKSANRRLARAGALRIPAASRRTGSGDDADRTAPPSSPSSRTRRRSSARWRAGCSRTRVAAQHRRRPGGARRRDVDRRRLARDEHRQAAPPATTGRPPRVGGRAGRQQRSDRAGVGRRRVEAGTEAAHRPGAEPRPVASGEAPADRRPSLRSLRRADDRVLDARAAGTYRCQGVSVPGACGRVSIDAERLEAWIGEYWVEALDGDHLPAQVVALTSDTREAAEEIATYRLRLDEATHARYVTGDLDDAAYKTVKRDLLAMIGEKESTLRRDRDAEQVAKLVGFGRSTWDGSTSEQRRHLLRLLVDRITVAPLTGKGRFDPSRARVALRS